MAPAARSAAPSSLPLPWRCGPAPSPAAARAQRGGAAPPQVRGRPPSTPLAGGLPLFRALARRRRRPWPSRAGATAERLLSSGGEQLRPCPGLLSSRRRGGTPSRRGPCSELRRCPGGVVGGALSRTPARHLELSGGAPRALRRASSALPLRLELTAAASPSAPACGGGREQGRAPAALLWQRRLGTGEGRTRGPARVSLARLLFCAGCAVREAVRHFTELLGAPRCRGKNAKGEL